MDTRDLYKLVRELSEEHDDVINLYDSVGIELSEDFVIETGVVGFTEDGIIIHLDEDAMEMLDLNGILLEAMDTEDSEGVMTIDEFIQEFKSTADPYELLYDAISGDYGEEIRKEIQDHYDDVVISSQGRLHPDDDVEDIIANVVFQLDKEYEVSEGAYSDHQDSKYDDDSTDPSVTARDKERAGGRRRAEDDGWDPKRDEIDEELSQIKRLAGRDEVDEGAGKAFLGGVALIAAMIGGNKMNAHHLMTTEPQLVTLTQMRQEAEQKGDNYEVKQLDDRIKKTLDHISITGRPVMGGDGEPIDPRKPWAGESVNEAEYQGRKVTLNKPMAGDVKKSKVYVKNAKGNVVKVNFGDKNMKIKKSIPGRRKSFRARHNCDNPGPKWKARYWSCRAW